MAKLPKETPTKWAVRLAAALCSLAYCFAAHAQPASPWVANDHARTRLVSAVTAVGDRETLPLGLEFQMAAGWKIYWRSPGDAGFPPTIDWSQSTNLAAVAIDWPVPQRYEIFGLTTYVYQDAVVLPLRVTPLAAGRPVALRGQISYLLCDQICIPYEASVSLDLPAGESGATEFAPAIARFQAQVPRQIRIGQSAQGLSIERAVLTRAPRIAGSKTERGTLEVLARASQPFRAPDLLVEGPSQMSVGPPEVHLSDDDTSALLRLPVTLSGWSPAMQTMPPLTLTLIDGPRAIEQIIAPESQTGNGAMAVSPLLSIVLLALLGGFILNFMPCVLPVLSLKLINAVGQSGRDGRQIRASFLATASGIVLSLAALGGVVIAFKSAGVVVGWGAQFQQPVFLAIMCLVVTLFAANLWGLFAIALPQVIGEAAARAPVKGLAGDFATGVFATLLATPCSAPFLGTAVGFALTRGTTEILAVFAALGVGLALPYLMVAAAPGVARLLPRPGPWMIALRRMLGVVLIATVVWLLSVLHVQTGWSLTLTLAAALAAVLLGLWIRQEAAGRGVLRAMAGYAAIAGACVAVALPVVMAHTPVALDVPSRAWQSFDRVRIFNAVAQGEVVLVDVTADWCLTCQVNKALVLERGEVQARIEAGEVLALRADWTRPNRAIADYLASFGRYGIPFNVVYGPAAPTGIPLPELLTAEDVLAALDRAARPPTSGAVGGI